VRDWLAPLLGTRMQLPTTTEIDTDAREVLTHLYALLERLSVKDRTIYTLRYIEGLEQAEISEVLGVSVSTVRRKLDRLGKRISSLMRSDPALHGYLRRMGRTPAEG
jgi:RNA polymerase sigma factor (sigma-70 family)